MKEDKKRVFVPLDTVIAMSSEVRVAKNIAAFHLEHEVGLNPAMTWGDTPVPLLCDYYSCLHALQNLLEETILDEEVVLAAMSGTVEEDGNSDIPISTDSLQILQTLMEHAQVIKTTLSTTGFSMEVH